MIKPFRFGAIEVLAPSGAAWTRLVRSIEDRGFSTLQIVDHFSPQFAPIPALAAAASVTTTLRLATQVLDNDYRHPVMVAKESATLDVLSEGRFELGIGAGWDINDYDQAGLVFDPASQRIDRLEEALAVIRGCFDPGPFSFSGQHYTITDFDCLPKPIQKPGPPIVIGAGAQRMLSVAGREADVISVNFDLRSGARRQRAPATVGGLMTPDVTPSGTADAVAKKLQWIRDAAGERFDQIELNVSAFLTEITDDRNGAAERHAAAVGVSPQELLESPFALIGSPGQIVETLLERRERFGFSYITFPVGIIEGGYTAIQPIVDSLAGR